jgi:high frequency lysogenization protein
VTDTFSAAEFRLLALASTVQAAFLVHATATGRPVDRAARTALLATVATHNAGALDEVFPNPQHLALGTRVLHDALAGKAVTPDVARYALGLVNLAGRLRKNAPVLDQLGALLTGLQDEPSAAMLAHIYAETIATLGKRIQVTGAADRLRDATVAADVRALLLGGVRCAWLWQQLGGHRWQLILHRRKLLLALATLHKKLQPH